MTVQLGGQLVVSDIGFHVAAGQCLCLTGSSGVGKSTVLKAVVDIVPRVSGSVATHGCRIAYLFQEHRLLPWCSARQNVALFASPRQDIDGLLRRLDLDEADDNKYPYELSGGMCQRIALARALAYQPDLLLMDEPFSALDHSLRLRLQDIVMEWMHERSLAVLMVTHDREEALRLADEIIRLNGKPATVCGCLSLDTAHLQRSEAFIRSHLAHGIFHGITE